ncbi:SHOCT domain-containing protein [Marinobacter sp.]|uniref:SHOCT domain-containing protein n=1 Tax=Marinobacter sp. TaxID=50741 RepID=UPI003A8D50D0
MQHGWEMMPWYGMIFGPIMMILVLATAVTVVILLVRWLGGGSGAPFRDNRRSSKAALDILKERFAKGEIDKDEFEEKKRLLSD